MMHPSTDRTVHPFTDAGQCECACLMCVPLYSPLACRTFPQLWTHAHTNDHIITTRTFFFWLRWSIFSLFVVTTFFFTNLNLIIFKTIWPICSTDRPFSRHFSFFLCNFVIACEMDALRKALEVFWESTEKSGTKYVLTFLELTRATEQQTKMCANCGYVCGHTIIPEPTPAHYCHFKRQSCLHCTTARQYVECSAVCVILNLNIIVHSTMAVVLMLKSCQNYCQTHKWCQE